MPAVGRCPLALPQTHAVLRQIEHNGVGLSIQLEFLLATQCPRVALVHVGVGLGLLCGDAVVPAGQGNTGIGLRGADELHLEVGHGNGFADGDIDDLAEAGLAAGSGGWLQGSHEQAEAEQVSQGHRCQPVAISVYAER